MAKNKNLVSTTRIKLAPISAERNYLRREKLDRVMSRIAQRVARLKKQRDELDVQLELPMPEGELARLRDGRIIERVVVPVQPIVINDEWLEEHPDRVARKGYEYVKYKVSDE